MTQSMRRMLVAMLCCVSLAAGCASSDETETVLVMAAASLTDAFTSMEAVFEAANPTVDVQLNVGGSGALREQILQGAPADVFASANEATMAQVVQAGDASAATAFASNTLIIAVPAGNPADIRSIEDLSEESHLIGLCAEQVPCGDFAREALAQAGVVASVDTNEGDVRSLLTKLEAGELDAGIVYVTDAASSNEVEAIALPATVDVAVTYPIATLTESPNTAAAQAFVEFVQSAQGQQILADHGFGPAP